MIYISATGAPTQVKASCQACDTEVRIYLFPATFTEQEWQRHFNAQVDADGEIQWVPSPARVVFDDQVR